MALLSRKPGRRLILYIGMFGAALGTATAFLTPAISVLSALEGLDVIAPELGRFVLPGAVAILAALLAVQQRGTAALGRSPGPVMGTWFGVLAVLGLWGIAQYPAVLWAVNPGTGSAFPVFRRWQSHAGARWRVPFASPGRRRSMLTSAIWPRADPVGLVRGFPGAGPELCRASGHRAGAAWARRGKSLLPPLPRAGVAAAPRHTRHDCNRRREPGGHHGCFFDNVSGDPVGLRLPRL